MNPPKSCILHISTETGWRGGERQVQLLTDGMLERGWPCLVACPPSSALFADRQQKGLALALPATGELDLLAVARLVRLTRQYRVALLHAHTSHAHTLAWLAGNILGLPVVVTRRVDFPISQNVLSRRKYLSSRVTFIAISRGVGDVLAAGGVPPERIHIVHSGVDLSRYPYREGPRDEGAAARWGIRPGEALILNVAALVDHKDHLTLLRAAAILRELVPTPWKILVAGSGELESQLRRAIADLQLADRVIMLGYIADLSSLYRAADVFVLSSHLEGLCTSILDSMSAGVPVVATRTGGIPEAVEHEVTGLLVRPRQPAELANALARILREPRLRTALAEAARHKVLHEFSAEAMIEGTIHVYRSVLGV
ncbi:MAG: glycosyltransferase family 4 protein [Candidatus Sumerlaeaceae bacterium]|nr:glycosyltransferase family 4 protein [Candidatus Sumerlaeaceae bacterium]